MKILIVDNEPDLRAVLKEMIQAINLPDCTIEEADGVQTGVEKIHLFQPDIVFLDIEMNDGTGFDLLKQIDKPRFQLIFTTAHNQYAVMAFKFSALDYLLKPIDPEELRESLKKASDNISNGSLQHQLAILMQQLNVKADNNDKQIVLKDIDKTYFIKINDILYCEAEGAYTKFFIQNIDPIFVSRNLRSYEDLLAPYGFIRTHHSCLVNPKSIKIYDRKTDGGMLILDGGFSIPVSKRKKDFIVQYLEGRA